MALLPKVKLKAVVSFPAAVFGGAGIAVRQENGRFYFDLAFSDFAPPVAALPDPANQNALLWNAVTGAYVLAPVSLLGGIPDAPNDGTQYGRQSLGWTPITGGGGGIPDAPSDGTIYGRQNAAWVAAGGLPAPEDYGAVGDGTTDDTSAINAALAATSVLYGGGKTYAVSGDIVIPNNLTLIHIRFKQLNPNVALRRTLTNTTPISNIYFHRVIVDRNGDGATGTPGESGGIFFDDISDFVLEDCEVIGNNKGIGIMLRDATNGHLVRPYVHDITYDDVAASDDVLNGIYLETCTRVNLVHPIVRDLAGNPGGVTSNRYTRGICIVGTIDCNVLQPEVYKVDQGVDVSGATFNRGLDIIGGHAQDCYTFGFKFANTAVSCRIIGARAEDCGLAGFVASGPSASSLPDKTSYIDMVDCEALNPGSNGVYAGSDTCGFSVQAGTFDTDYPHGVRLIGCRARDTQGSATMKFGFRNNVTLAATRQFNEVLDCVSVGHITAAMGGFNSATVKLTRSAVQSIPNNISTAIVWTVETFDNGLQHAASNANVVITRAGWYQPSASIYWLQHLTGIRTAQILLNGGTIPGGIVSGPTQGNDFTQFIQTAVYCEPGDTLRVEVVQNSGAALDVRNEYSSFTVMPLRVT